MFTAKLDDKTPIDLYHEPITYVRVVRQEPVPEVNQVLHMPGGEKYLILTVDPVRDVTQGGCWVLTVAKID